MLFCSLRTKTSLLQMYIRGFSKPWLRLHALFGDKWPVNEPLRAFVLQKVFSLQFLQTRSLTHYVCVQNSGPLFWLVHGISSVIYIVQSHHDPLQKEWCQQLFYCDLFRIWSSSHIVTGDVFNYRCTTESDLRSCLVILGNTN